MTLSNEEGEHICQNCGPDPGYGEPGLGVQHKAQNDEHCLQDGEDQSEEEMLLVASHQTKDGIGSD